MNIHSVIEMLSDHNLQAAIGDEKLPGTVGRILGAAVEDPSVEQRLHQIPSETSPAERRLLYNFFRYFWFAKADVLEIGPFLGGTTRAIALGMLHNPFYSPARALHTYDRFNGYYTGSALDEYLTPLFSSGVLPASSRARLRDSNEKVEFKELFDTIHQSLDYYPVLRTHAAALPDSESQPHLDCAPFSLAPDAKFECVFVDGCKSWYGTKTFFLEISASLEPGTFVLMQDYGWYSCFWISSFVECFGSHFQLIANVESTYAFRLTKRLTNDEIRRLFPDRPTDWNFAVFAALYERLLDGAAARGDYRQLVYGRMQLAAAYAYLGEAERARGVFRTLTSESYAKPYAHRIAAARLSPTYTPEGKVTLDW